MSSCPTTLQMEEYLMDAAASPVADHLSSCVRCQQVLEEMRALGGEFRRSVYPRTAGAVLDSVERPSWTRRALQWFSPAAVVVAAAAACFLILPVRTSNQRDERGEYVGTKGEPIILTAFTRTLDGAEPVSDGGRVPSGSALRFEVHASEPCHLWLVSVDDLRHVSRLYPTSGAPSTHTGGALPGGIILDERTGPERIFAVCSPDPLPYAVVEEAARTVGAGGIQQLRRAHTLEGLPATALQASLLVEKAR